LSKPLKVGKKMTKAYVIANFKVTEPKGYALHIKQMLPTVEKFGGKYIVRGGAATQLEGPMLGERHIVIEFPNRSSAEGWLDSEDYKKTVDLRRKSSTAWMVLVEGHDPTTR
jgi:uncharacterized protein (DUF1330 family)